jgi:arylformamidase
MAVVDPALEARRAEQRARTESLRAEFRHELNLAYGPYPAQVLDIYYPNTHATPTATPTLVFLHGGGFRRGAPGFNAYHGRPYLERGAVFVSMGYRLAPDARFPDSLEDVELGLSWLAARRLDANRIYLSGHSAGAVLAAWLGLRGSSTPAPAGLVLISGMYDLSRHSEEIMNRASPRFVPRLYEAIERTPANTVIVAGDNDLPSVLPDARALREALQARGASVVFHVEPQADHFEANRSFITPGAQVSESVCRMMSL